MTSNDVEVQKDESDKPEVEEVESLVEIFTIPIITSTDDGPSPPVLDFITLVLPRLLLI